MSDRPIKLYLTDIKEAIGKIEGYIIGMSFGDFKSDSRTVDAVVRNIEIIGEAAKHRKEIVGTRSKAIHEYFGIDLEILWKTATQDISELKRQIDRIEV